MWYIIGIIIITIGFLININIKAKAKTQNKKELRINSKEHSSVFVNPIDTIKPMYSIKDIKTKLKRLAETAPPKDLAFGAKCYSKSMPPETASYTCPECGEKTLYKAKADKYVNMNLLSYGLNACRNEISLVKGVNIKLDESEFCKKCSPDVEIPRLCLLLNISNTQDTIKRYNINYLDIRLIREFLNDKLKHKNSFDFESPLVNYIERIQQLIGVNYKKEDNE